MNYDAVDLLPWGIFEPLYTLLVQGQFTTLIVTAVILLIVGNYAATFQPRAQKIGLVIGGLIFVGFLMLLFGRSPEDFADSIVAAVVRGVVVGAIFIAVSWIVLTLLFALWHSVILPPFRSVKRSTQERFSNYRHEMNEARLQKENERLQERLTKALERVTTLENRPGALPDNVDAVTRLTVEWSRERERILRNGGDEVRWQLDLLDAKCGRELAKLLEQQERELSG